MNRKVTMTNEQALSLNHSLRGLKDIGKVSFKYFISKNLKTLADLLIPLEEVDKNNREIRAEYDKDFMNKILIPYAVKDKNGQPLPLPNGQISININSELQKKEDEVMTTTGSLSKELALEIQNDRIARSKVVKDIISELDSKYEKELKDFKEKSDELALILKEEIDLELRAISLVAIPDEIPRSLMDLLILHDLIED